MARNRKDTVKGGERSLTPPLFEQEAPLKLAPADKVGGASGGARRLRHLAAQSPRTAGAAACDADSVAAPLRLSRRLGRTSSVQHDVDVYGAGDRVEHRGEGGA